MAVPKAAVYMAVLLVICNSLENQEYGQSLTVFFEKGMGSDVSNIHVREKRSTPINYTEYRLQAVVTVSDVEEVRRILSTRIFPYELNGTGEITSIGITTVCLSSVMGYQCTCEESFAWSYSNCITHGTCDVIVGDTCGCINALPADGQYCQQNTSQIETTTTPMLTTTPLPATPPPNNPVDIKLDLSITVSGVPPDFITVFRENLRNFSLPHPINQSLNVSGLIFTTGCSPNSTGGLQCECEENFAWSCDKCNIYGACSNATSPTCGCINGLPSDRQFCEPIASITTCPTPTLAMSTTTPPMPTTTPPMSTTTPPMPTTTPPMSTTTPPMPTTTPPMPTTTPPMSTTAPPMPTTTPPMSTTAPPMPTTTPPMPTTPPVQTTTTTAVSDERSFELILNIVYIESYSNSDNQVYQDMNNAIQIQSREHIKDLQSVEITEVRSGSTIATYTVTATSFVEAEIAAVKIGLFTELEGKQPVIFDSDASLQFDPPAVFFGKTVKVSCGPPPVELNFGTNWTPEWTRNSEVIREDTLHSISMQEEVAILTVSRFFLTDNGLYECKLIRNDSSVFRQKSSKPFSYKNEPLIQVTPPGGQVECGSGTLRLTCSTDNNSYNVTFQNDLGADSDIFDFIIPDCDNVGNNPEVTFTCQTITNPVFQKNIKLEISEDIVCFSTRFGDGAANHTATAPCSQADEVGLVTAVCLENGTYQIQKESCILRAIQILLLQSEFLTNETIPAFLVELRNVIVNSTARVVESPNNIRAIVEILSNVANTSNFSLTESSMKDILLTVGILTTEEAKDSWDILNANDTRTNSVTRNSAPIAKSVSSSLLESLEITTRRLINDTFDIETSFILLNKTTFTDAFSADVSSSVGINLTEAEGGNQSITVITFASMDNVLPARDQDNSSSNIINGRVVLVQASGTVTNITITFDIINDTLGNPNCVFWNFSLFDGLGGWDDEGCMLVLNKNETITCNCNHLTSFSMLMSPNSPDDPVLTYITYVGVSISMASLVICLIIEGVIWRKIRRHTMSYLRHVSNVNIAVSLLIANIWFFVGAAISEAEPRNQQACIAATFFIHVFYLALFFWMLASALLLLYGVVSVFGGGSKSSMLAIGFCLGYGAPLIIATITIAVTAPDKYVRRTGGCWLNWDESKALLAFVILALLIVLINFIILLVVIYKMLRRMVMTDAAHEDRNVLVVIARSLAVLTPFFGLTWSLGVGTMAEPDNRGLHISFAFFNSLQGFFILVFGTLLDKKVRKEIAIKSQTSQSGTRTTSGGNSSSGLGFLRNLRQGREGYNISSVSGESQPFTNT